MASAKRVRVLLVWSRRSQLLGTWLAGERPLFYTLWLAKAENNYSDRYDQDYLDRFAHCGAWADWALSVYDVVVFAERIHELTNSFPATNPS